MEVPPIVDSDRLLCVSRGNVERAREFFTTLAIEARSALAKIDDALAIGDLVAVRDLAHALKGMALEVGAPCLAAAAAALDAERDPVAFADRAAAVARACDDLRDVLPFAPRYAFITSHGYEGYGTFRRGERKATATV